MVTAHTLLQNSNPHILILPVDVDVGAVIVIVVEVHHQVLHPLLPCRQAGIQE